MSDVKTELSAIIDEVCAKRGHSKTRVLGRTCQPEHAHTRYEIFYRARIGLPLSLKRIGQEVGGYDHSTVAYGIGRHYCVLNDICMDRLKVKDIQKLCARVPAKLPPGNLRGKTLREYRAEKDRLERENGIIAKNKHRTEFVLEWIADGGTAYEALEPYGFSEKQTSRFLGEYLPDLKGLRQDQKIQKARELLGRKVAA
jgi:hypothetical protein